MDDVALRRRVGAADERYLRVLGAERRLGAAPAEPPQAPETVAASWRTNDGRAHAWAGAVDQYWTWREEARCQDLDSALFFSPDGERGPTRRRRERAAKAVCARCHVQSQCAAFALANREPYGVWGGLTETERETLWRRDAKAAKATKATKPAPAAS